MSNIITAEHITHKFHETIILDDLSFSIPSGSITTLIGPNGAGKSTLIKIIMGILKPSSGQITINGQPPANQRSIIGYVPQRFAPPERVQMTVNEFLSFTTSLNTPSIKKFDRFEEKLNEVGLQQIQNKHINKLSGGQLQRVLIARTLLSDKKILILDEAVSSIDVEGKRSIQQLLTDLNKKNQTTIILISHELEVVFKYANHVLCIDRRILCQGVPAEAITQDILDQMYGGTHHGHYHHSCTHSQ